MATRAAPSVLPEQGPSMGAPENPFGSRLEPGAEPIAGYRLVRELGRGGFGEVWQAAGPDQAPVALKFMRLANDLAPAQASFLAVLQDIRHPNVLPVYATWHRPG